MLYRAAYLTLVIAVALPIFGVDSARPAMYRGRVEIVPAGPTGNSPVADEIFVYWIEQQANADYAIMRWDGTQTLVLFADSSEKADLQVSDGRLTWAQHPGNAQDIYFWDGTFPFVPLRITDDACADTDPTISGMRLAWLNWRCPGGTDLHYFDVGAWDHQSPIVPTVAFQSTSSTRAKSADVDGTNVIYDRDASPGGTPDPILLWDGITSSTQLIAAPNNGDHDPTISGNHGTWARDDGIDFWDGASIVPLSQDENDLAPLVSGSLVAWTRVNADASSDVYYWDGSEWNSQVPVSPLPVRLTYNDGTGLKSFVTGLSSTMMAWHTYDANSGNYSMYRIRYSSSEPVAMPPSPPEVDCELGYSENGKWVPIGDAAIPPAGTATGLVVVTHGWDRPGEANPQPGMQEMADSLASTLTVLGVDDEWNVMACHWGSDFFWPTDAFAEALTRGFRLGSALSSVAGYTRFHFIGHSAGTWLINEAARTLDITRPGTVVHTTFLDAFVPTSCDALGETATWADHYFSAPDEHELAIATDYALPSAFNVKVGDTGHSLPISWYLSTIQTPVAGSWGFAKTDEFAELPNYSATYPQGGLEDFGAPHGVEYCDEEVSSNTLASLMSSETEGDVTIGFEEVVLRTGSPAWLVADIDSPTDFDAIEIEVEFLSASEGWLGVFFEREAVLGVDERHMAPGSQRLRLPLKTLHPAGSYEVAFRLDTSAATTSEVRVAAVRFARTVGLASVGVFTGTGSLLLGGALVCAGIATVRRRLNERRAGTQ